MNHQIIQWISLSDDISSSIILHAQSEKEANQWREEIVLLKPKNSRESRYSVKLEGIEDILTPEQQNQIIEDLTSKINFLKEEADGFEGELLEMHNRLISLYEGELKKQIENIKNT